MSFLTEEQLLQYRENGYIIVRGLLSPDEVGQTKAEMRRVIDEWCDNIDAPGEEGPAWKQIVSRDPSVRRGEVTPENRYRSVRKLYRMTTKHKFFARQARHEKLVAACRQVIGDNVRLLQSMALLKPPGSAEKRWHQDNAYFRLTPLDVMGCWIAIDEAFVANGCMHVLSKSHCDGIALHKLPGDTHDRDPSNSGAVLYGLAEVPDTSEVTALPMNPGDALLFHGALKHFTPPNNSTADRYAVQYHYAAAHCQPTTCPEDMPGTVKATPGAEDDIVSDERPAVFDCDPCVEPQFWFFRKAEMTVIGEERGGGYL